MKDDKNADVAESGRTAHARIVDNEPVYGGASDPPELKSLDARVGELLRSELWEDSYEERYDRFTRLVGRIFDAPEALIVLFDEAQYSFKSRFGFQLGTARAEIELCRQTADYRDVFVIEDMHGEGSKSQDAGDEQARNMRFFAGRALHTDAGAVVGCVALLDFKPRAFDVSARQTLAEIALLVEEEFTLNEALASTRAGMAELLDRDAALPSATHIIAYEKIELLAEQARDGRRKLGIFYLSVDNLYDMSLAYGPGRIQAMINRWMDDLRDNNDNLIYIARLTERGFVGAFEFDGSVHAARRHCEQLRARAQCEIAHEDVHFSFEASCGLCVHPDHGDSGVALIGRAQLAHENQSWAGDTALFNAAIAKRFRRQAALRTRFESAVRNGDVTFHAQPIFANADQSLMGVELLARWQDAELGEVSPTEFVPVIDPEKGPRRALVAYALDSACRYIAAWQAASRFVPYVTINVPGAEVLQHDFHDLIDATLARHDVEGRHLVFELTERSVIRDFERMARGLRRLTETGARIAIDDFGSGYSSIAYLTRLPVSIVKLDKRVVQHIEHEGAAHELARGIVALAHGQDLLVVAEGVETQQQWDRIQTMGCEYVQGYLLERPMPEPALFELVEQHRAGSAKHGDNERAPE
ncbi:GGDEF domain-containing phosphodiesterase [Salinisphaera shabanensis]|uniref:GGDEF domain-containing phosphodiesterase n=1 Tax=Salinisphaera shabanensis TaxID=180542 RepID=UPI00021212F9|nr:GGDEF domain-containing phosphodiesterase [Salinisphaera shabanensis]